MGRGEDSSLKVHIGKHSHLVHLEQVSSYKCRKNYKPENINKTSVQVRKTIFSTVSNLKSYPNCLFHNISHNDHPK